MTSAPCSSPGKMQEKKKTSENDMEQIGLRHQKGLSSDSGTLNMESGGLQRCLAPDLWNSNILVSLFSPTLPFQFDGVIHPPWRSPTQYVIFSIYFLLLTQGSPALDGYLTRPNPLHSSSGSTMQQSGARALRPSCLCSSHSLPTYEVWDLELVT